MMFFYISLLRDYIAGGKDIEIPQLIEVESELEWELESILRHKKERKLINPAIFR